MYCIYKITNLINGKTYIGQHKYLELNDKYMGSGKHLKRALKKYGIENFRKDILVFNISNKEYVDLLERVFIASEREKVGAENCYNIVDGGQGGSLKGRTCSEQSKRRMSEARKGKHLSDETKKKISEALKGRSTWNKGKHHSDETKKKISEGNKGKHLSEQTKKRMSEAKKGCYKGKHWKLVDGKRVWY
jgi:group I intron endonuclease